MAIRTWGERLGTRLGGRNTIDAMGAEIFELRIALRVAQFSALQDRAELLKERDELRAVIEKATRSTE